MKRIIFITIACGFLLAGCTHLAEGRSNSINHSDSLGSCSSNGHLFYNDYDEYLSFFEVDAEVPVNLVHYEQIESLGQFQWFEGDYWTNDEGKIVAHYHYRLEDDCGRAFSISGFAYPLYQSNKTTNDVNLNDLRSILAEGDEYRTFVSDNLKYVYRPKDGALHNVYWEIDGFGFMLSANSGFSSFEPNPEGTFAERLLCLESAPAAVEEFEQMISIPYEPDTNTSH